MYSIEEKPYGLKLLFKGRIELEEMQQWSKELKVKILEQKPDFGVLVDVQEMVVMDPATIQVVIEAQNFAKEHGTGRNANIVSNRLAKMQQTRLARESGLYSYMRYIDGESEKTPEKLAEKWILHGIDPDN